MKKRELIALLMLLSFAACDRTPATSLDGHDHTKDQSASVSYTCPMHPHIKKDSPGQCPVCGMDLVPASSVSSDDWSIMLTDTQIKLANIRTQRISERPMGRTTVVNARLARNPELSNAMSSRMNGRIERLHVRETGRPVRKGEALYDLYSEELLTLQQEYLLALEQYEELGERESRYASFVDAAKRKLALYGFSEAQLRDLKNSRKPKANITFHSTASGIVSEINVTDGQYVSEGTPLFVVEDLSTLWVEAELFAGESAGISVGTKLDVVINGYGQQPIETEVTFIHPEFRSGQQIITVRGVIDNAASRFLPGMQAQVFVRHGARRSLALPVDAVIRSQAGTHVYVQRGRNNFVPQVVKTGLEDFNMVEITDGLSATDTVAVRGAYLLYSELVLKKGFNPMVDHKHH
jgi:membrane fusion protein, copper/silver efflux system